MFSWTLDTLLGIPTIDLVVINTDAREILENQGVRETDRLLIRDRRIELCGDTVSMNSILADDIENVASKTYLMTHTTNPLLSRSTINTALRRFEAEIKNDVDSLFTVNRIQSRFYSENGAAINHDPERLIQTQDLTPWFEENSCLYIFTRESFALTRARIGKKPILFETPKVESIDIDTQADWDLALAVASYLKSKGDRS